MENQDLSESIIDYFLAKRKLMEAEQFMGRVFKSQYTKKINDSTIEEIDEMLQHLSKLPECSSKRTLESGLENRKEELISIREQGDIAPIAYCC